jgi:origin recognition complex subunit 3
MQLHQEIMPIVSKVKHDFNNFNALKELFFSRYVENEKDPQKRVDLITSDDYLKIKLRDRIKISHRFFFDFFYCLRMLAVLIEDLPRNNLGKLHRELYPLCAASDITKQEEYQECLKLLRFSSKDKFIAKLDRILDILKAFDTDELMGDNLKKHVRTILVKIREFRESIAAAGLTPTKQDEPQTKTTPKVEINRKGVMGRQEMLDKLKESAKAHPARVVIEYERQLCNCIDFLNSTFESYLCPFSKAPALSELFIFSDCASIRRQIVGTPRASIHNALSNPHQYLQCKCCVMRDNENILSTLPDICIAYKLHLECNKFINLYDWLQAFAMVIGNNGDDDESEEISSEIQARFTRATAELQFLGLIKQAKHKTDHVMRMTW